MRRISDIVIHQSASPRSATASLIDQWHRERGWTGIGYHLVIEGDGRLARGRKLERVGAHCRRSNLHSIGICVVGDNAKPSCEWVSAQIVTLRSIVAVLSALLPDAQVRGHRDMPYASTVCPGLDVRELLGLGAIEP